MSGKSVENGTSRGEFLAKTAGVAGLAVGAGVWASGLAGDTEEAAAAAAGGRSSVNGYFALSLEGAQAGILKSARGGHVYAETIEELPIGNFVNKHIGQPKYEDITLQFGFSMSKAVYDWIQASWDDKATRKDGSIVAADDDRKIRHARIFFQALVTEFGIPACDASSKDPAYMTLKIAPEITQSLATSGKLTSPVDKHGKQWLPSNFRFELDGLSTKKVSKIDAFTVKQAIVTSDIGDVRIPQREPGKLEFPNLKITFHESEVQGWADWADDFIFRGNNGQESEKNGRIVFLAPNLKTVLGSIYLHNVGILRVSSDKPEANADTIKRVTADVYVERMTLKYGSATIG